MSEPKIELGRKPELAEVLIFAEAIIAAGEKKLEADVKKFMKAKGGDPDDEKMALTAVVMSFTLNKMGEMVKKFVEEGTVENPLEAKDVFEEIAKKAVDDEKKNGVKDLDEAITKVFSDEMDKGKKEDKKEKFSKDDVVDAFHIIDSNFKKVGVKLMDKYGGEAAVKFMATYCVSFLEMVEDWGKNGEDDDDEDEIEFPIKGSKEVSLKDALKEIRKDGHDDVADALEKLVATQGDAEIKVYKMEDKNKDKKKKK